MEEEVNPLTDIEQSRVDTGFRHYVVQEPTYVALSDAVNASRGYPWRHTVRGLPVVDDLLSATNGAGKLIAIDCWRFYPDDDAMINAATGIQELTYDQFVAIKPQPEGL